MTSNGAQKDHLRYSIKDPREVQRDACGVGFISSINGKRQHKVIRDGLKMLHNMDHRGGVGSCSLTGDGAGIMTQIPAELFAKELKTRGTKLPKPGHYGVGVVFLPRDGKAKAYCEDLVSRISEEEGCKAIHWRDVPTNDDNLGETASNDKPIFKHVFIVPDSIDAVLLEWKLYVIRKRIEHESQPILKSNREGHLFYIASLSTKTIVYKGLLLSGGIDQFYKDLTNPQYLSAFAMVHQRFSTNTHPKWRLAQPFRLLCHNGEINTLRGNITWMHARQSLLSSPTFGDDLKKLGEICMDGGSDSSILDNVVELLVRTGRPIEQVMSMVIPEPWEHHEELPKKLKEYYEYQSLLMEPWDGPAFVGFTDGKKIGAVLDRNGLRPGRYYVTASGFVVMASEAGTLEIEAEEIVYKGRLQPGKMFLIDTESGTILSDKKIKDSLANQKPYGEWIQSKGIQLAPSPIETEAGREEDLLTQMKAHGYTQEDQRVIITPMALTGKEPVGSMGTDTPLAALSTKPISLFYYFKQLFAQVTNPPIDAIREEMITSLMTIIGSEGNLLDETPEQARVLRLPQPILNLEELSSLKTMDQPGFRSTVIDTTYHVEESLKEGLDRIREQAKQSILAGRNILILSDATINQERLPIPSLLATGAIHHHLIRQNIRTRATLVVAGGDIREVHHCALLIGYGASAICPYLPLKIFEHDSTIVSSDLSSNELRANYIAAIGQGLLKIMSKMGISTLASYQGAQIFEAIGLQQSLVDEYFTWTPTRIEGIGLDTIELESRSLHSTAFMNKPLQQALPQGGQYHWRPDGEQHLHSPNMLTRMQKAIRLRSKEEFTAFCRDLDDQADGPINLRGLMDFKYPAKPIDLEQVEPVTEIMRRFSTGAMSLGSISKETHETMAIAMNRIGAKSNSGEGGEDERRFHRDPTGDLRNSAIKQVASGRFGVTIHYLSHAREIQIKIAQGAKPGEGGQLPGHKVTEDIAKLRHSTPGITLISPPPHHDIYSIEDLAQLIFDLKNANPRAKVSVKLVSCAGVGTVAAGVAKAKADSILISGYEGGTGASPITSIKHAGLPWELGLAEAHEILVDNNLRDRITLSADGQLRTAKDLAIATMLGAEEWGIGSGALVALGCIMMRKCHLNTCPVGIATQDPKLRRLYKGQPEHLINYFYLLAEEFRALMAKLGVRTVRELVGRRDLLIKSQRSLNKKQGSINLDVLLKPVVSPSGQPVHQARHQDHGIASTLDARWLIKACKKAIAGKGEVQMTLPISNTDRAVGTLLSHEISTRNGAQGLKQDAILLRFKGSAGQSFMAFGAPGIFAQVEGEVNDYVGKGLSGGKIIVLPPKEGTLIAESNIICGNVALYGATSGEVYIRGIAGERFAVRNSGATAVVEGVGDHGCEYMTGGTVLILGSTGRNFGAGMSGGVAYVYDPDQDFKAKVNQELVLLSKLSSARDLQAVVQLLERHVHYTQSHLGQQLLKDPQHLMNSIVQVIPRAFLEHHQSSPTVCIDGTGLEHIPESAANSPKSLNL